MNADEAKNAFCISNDFDELGCIEDF